MGSQRDKVMAAQAWETNSDLLLDLRELGYIWDDASVFDPTYGSGVWWKYWEPKNLTVLRGKRAGDFRHTEYPDESFDVIVFDPTYVAQGGRRTSTVQPRNKRYGMHDAPKSPAALQRHNNEGITEMFRLLRPGGYLLVKCKNYVSSGKVFPGEHLTFNHAMSVGFRYHDEACHISGTGPQSQNSQQHLRQNYSTMLVFRKPPRRRARG